TGAHFRPGVQLRAGDMHSIHPQTGYRPVAPDEDATFAPDSLDPEFAGFRAQRQLPAGRGNGNAGSWTSRPGLLATPGGEVVALEASGCTIDQYIVCAVEMHCFPRHALDDDVGESQARTGGF